MPATALHSPGNQVLESIWREGFGAGMAAPIAESARSDDVLGLVPPSILARHEMFRGAPELGRFFPREPVLCREPIRLT